MIRALLFQTVVLRAFVAGVLGSFVGSPNDPGLSSGGGGTTFGTAVARPAATQANKGQSYYATDTKEITFSDGSAWQSIGYTTNNGFGVANTNTTIFRNADGNLATNTPAMHVGVGAYFTQNGVPNNGLGVDGDLCLRTDTPTTANQRLYNKQAGVWVGIL